MIARQFQKLRLYFFSMLVFGLAVVIQAHSYLNWDSLWLMTATERWLSGGTYVQNFVENNPPLILYLTAVPAWFAKILSFSNIAAQFIFFFFISMVSLALSYFLLQRLSKSTQLIFLLTTTLVVIHWLLPAHAFGERECLMVALIMPYLLLLALRLQRQKIPIFLAVFIGFFAMLGFGLKPYFFITLCLIELYRYYVLRNYRAWLQPECVTLVISLLLYGVSIFILTPTYITNVLPIALNFYVGFEKSSFIVLTNVSVFLQTPIFIALLLPVIFRKLFNNIHLFWIFYLNLLGFLIVYFWQGKAWYYHLFPVVAFAILVLLCGFGLIRARLLKNDVWISVFLAVLFFLGPIVWLCMVNEQSVIKGHATTSENALIQAIRETGYHQTVYLFSTTLSILQPIVYADAQSVSRFPVFWMLPGLTACLQDKNAACYSQALKTKQFLLQAVASDFKHNKPSIVMITNKLKPRYFMTPSFHWIHFFSENKQFRDEWQHYRYFMTVSGYRFYQRV